MTTLVKISVAILFALLLSSCAFDFSIGDFGTGKKGNGIVVEESRTVTADFEQVSASEGIIVHLTQADDFAISVEADENIIDLIATDINNGKLKIHAIENIGAATKNVFVSLPHISALKSSSGAQLTAQNTITSNALTLKASSGSILHAAIAVKELELDASSGANINIQGKANDVLIDGSSGANINAKKLLATHCNAEASSGANVSVHVSQALTADASSGGSISYAGDATVMKNTSVSGSVNKY